MLFARPFASLLLAKHHARMLFAKSSTRFLAIVTVFSIVTSQCAAYADQCESCGAPLAAAVAGDLALTSTKSKGKSLLTDSLWGNLILELAYERDSELSKLAKKVKLMNAATTVSVLGLAAATLAQGITALYVLNPPNGAPDSYAPLNVGVATSSAMIGVMAARLYCGHKLAQHLQQRQIQIRDRVQTVLAHVEYSRGECVAAKAQLTALIGTRASNEWMQLWQSSHQKLAGTTPHISLHTDPQGNALSNAAISTEGLMPAEMVVAEAPAKTSAGTKN
jgi:hypothetical protein